jgi:hypothetical protein
VRERHYSPQLSRLVVCALYHEAKLRKVPMTRLADELLATALQHTDSMQIAKQTISSSPKDRADDPKDLTASRG